MAGESLSEPIAHIINSSLRTNTFPHKWKLARVLPLLKSKGADTSNPSSFRPVSQLPLVWKLTERTVQIQLLKHLEHWGLLGSNHHAYRLKTNTTTALLDIMDQIGTGADENEIIGTIGVDQTAAFDCVEHEILLKKLGFYSLSSEVLQWITSYLNYRSSFVAIGSGESQILQTKYGVPQGSVLGPLLYLRYVNKFPTNTKDENCSNDCHNDRCRLWDTDCLECGTITIFADDAEYITKSKYRWKNQDRIERNFVNIVNFLNANGLEINQSKTVLTEFMTKQKRARCPGIPPDLTVTEPVGDRMEDSHITDRKYCRILGANLQNNLSWDNHLNTGKHAILPGVRRQLGGLYSLRKSLTVRGKLQLANSLILSRMIYAISLWGNTTQNAIKQAQICLNSTARFVLDAPKTTRQSDLMRRCNWLDILESTEYFSLIQLWKVLRWEVSVYMRGKFSLIEEDRVRTKEPRLQLTADGWRCKTSLRWNLLPERLRGEHSLRAFKVGLRRHIVERRTAREPD